jgi:Flp pilus assembly protein TadB
MSAARTPREAGRSPTGRSPERRARSAGDISKLRARRREAHRRRRLLRVDLGLGLLGAVLLLILTPGVAIAALFALVLLAVCILSVVLERRRARRR